mgnify:CR=1 FL=1
MMNEEYSMDMITVIRDMGESYIVRISQIDEKTGVRKEHIDVIKHELFEICIKCGYLERIKA